MWHIDGKKMTSGLKDSDLLDRICRPKLRIFGLLNIFVPNIQVI